MPIGPNRELHSACTLQHDHNLHPTFDKTVLILYDGIHKQKLLDIYHNFGIDTSRFELVHDKELIGDQTWTGRYPRWIRQQLIKILAFARFDYDLCLLQDCDTFCIQPFTWWQDGPILFYLPKILYPADYDFYAQAITGFKPSEHNFVTEFVPMNKKTWNAINHKRSLIDRVQQALAENYTNRPWIAESQIINHWMISRHVGTQLVVQRRFNIDHTNIAAIKAQHSWFDTLLNFNVICIYDQHYQLDHDDIGFIVDSIRNHKLQHT